METNTAHLVLAALFGASIMLFSNYYMNRSTLNSVLELAKSVEKEREREEESEGDSPQHSRRRRVHARRRANGYRRASASMPDVTAISAGGIDSQENPNGTIPVEGIPAGLPRLHTLHEGIAFFDFSPDNLRQQILVSCGDSMALP